MKTAFILTDGQLDKTVCKTAHGLIFGHSRYKILGVIDSENAGKDAGEVVTKQKKDIPVFSSTQQGMEILGIKPYYCVIGVAPVGGKLSDSLVDAITDAISSGINIVSGLHTLLNHHPVIAPLAQEKNVKLIDIRKPKSSAELNPWSGKIASVKTPRVAVIGTDCALGKRTTAGLLLDLCNENHIKAEMIYTGQTGWLQGMKYGFILDSTLNDFVSGEMEQAILRCVNEASPDIIFIEGQSALRNPSGPCGAEHLLSAGSKYVILQHCPSRKYFKGDTEQNYKIPDIKEEVELIKFYGAEVIAITLNSEGLAQDEMEKIKNEIHEKTKLPVVYPREQGVTALLPILKKIIG